MIYIDLYYCVRDLQKCRTPRHRQDIPKVVKYSCLKGALRGSTASVIAGISITMKVTMLQYKFYRKGLEIKK